jgi:hypothetical protein
VKVTYPDEKKSRFALIILVHMGVRVLFGMFWSHETLCVIFLFLEKS